MCLLECLAGGQRGNTNNVNCEHSMVTLSLERLTSGVLNGLNILSAIGSFSQRFWNRSAPRLPGSTVAETVMSLNTIGLRFSNFDLGNGRTLEALIVEWQILIDWAPGEGV